MEPYKVFADRIGGAKFGLSLPGHKFAMIKEARDAFVQQHPDVKVIDLGIGEPDECAPEKIARRLYEEARLKENRIYADNGIFAFKEAAARYLKRLLGLDFDPQTEINHCIGSKSALAALPLAFINPGDTVVATVPGYPVFPNMAGWLGGKVINLKLQPANNYLPDLNELQSVARSTRPKVVLLNYPNNPSGAVANLDFYKEVVAFAHRYHFVLVQDAAYADFVYEGGFCSPLQVEGGREVTIEVYSLSKSYNMQGYRLGFVVSSPPLLKAFAYVKNHLDSGQFIAIQKAGIEALDCSADCIELNRLKYRRRMERVVDILNKAGLKAQPSPGTFYLYVPVPSEWHSLRFESGESWSRYLMSQLGIVTIPWDDAGAYVRLAMTFETGTPDFSSEEEVFQALEKRLTSNLNREALA